MTFEIILVLAILAIEDAARLPVLRPLIPPNNTINVNPGNNSLIITDYAENLRRVGAVSHIS